MPILSGKPAHDHGYGVRNSGARSDVIAHPLNFVWTVIESGDDADGNWYASPGYHIVNKLGYVLTLKPWDDITQDAIYFLDDMDDDSDHEAEENT